VTIPQQYEAVLIDAMRPSFAERLAAKTTILELLSTSGSLKVGDLLNAVRDRCMDGVPPPQGDRLDLPASGDPLVVIQRESPTFAYNRWWLAAQTALAELVANGVVLPSVLAAAVNVPVSTGSSSWSHQVPALIPEIPKDGVLLADAFRKSPSFLLDANLYAEGAEAVLGERGLRCLEEAMAAQRRGLHLAAVNMLGAASEAAWYGIAERVAGDASALRNAMNVPNTAKVIALVAQELRNFGVPQTVVEELRVHGIYLRDLRNYGMHPRAEPTAGFERHFSDDTAGVLFLQSHRYFLRLAEAAQATT
jgi:hypothetical protein